MSAELPDPLTLARTAAVPHSLALDATHLYWTSPVERALWRVPLAGGEARVLARWPDGVGSPGPLAVDESHAYVGFEGERAIVRVPTSGGAVETLFADESDEWPVALAIDDTFIFWVSLFASPSRIPKAGGDRVEVSFDEPGPGYLHSIAVEGGQVFWSWCSLDELEKTRRTGTIRACNRLRGEARDLVPRGTQPRGFAVSGEWLFFVDGRRELRSLQLTSGEQDVLARCRGKAVVVGATAAAVYVLSGETLFSPLVLERVERVGKQRTTLASEAGRAVAIGRDVVAWYERGELRLARLSA